MTSQLEAAASIAKSLPSKQQEIEGLKRECAALKQANDKLLATAFDETREKHHQELESDMRRQIVALEQNVSKLREDHASVLDRLSEETRLHACKQEDYKALHLQHLELKEKQEQSAERLKFFLNESATDMEELDRALALVRSRADKAQLDDEFSFLLRDERGAGASHHAEVRALQAANAETALELDKAVKMLELEHTLTNEYKQKSRVLQEKLERQQREHELEAEEQARELDVRNAKIQQLQKQFEHVVYGTHQMRIADDDALVDPRSGFRQPSASAPEPALADVARGENILQMHLLRLEVTSEGASLFPSSAPSLFVTLDFFDFETQCSRVQTGLRIPLNHTCNFQVLVNETFLRYLLKGYMLLEVHEALGASFQTVGVSHVRFAHLLDDEAAAAGRKVPMAVQVFASNDPTVVLALLHFWVRFQVPMERAFRLHRERLKAMRALQGEQIADDVHPLARAAANALVVSVHSCDVTLFKQQGQRAAPSLFVAYRFWREPEHATKTVVSSTQPRFDSQQTYVVRETDDLDEYLAQEDVTFVVVDDEDEDESRFFGMTKLSLQALRSESTVSQQLELRDADEDLVGTLYVTLEWQRPYQLQHKQPAEESHVQQHDEDERVGDGHGDPRTHAEDEMPLHGEPPVASPRAQSSRASPDPPDVQIVVQPPTPVQPIQPIPQQQLSQQAALAEQEGGGARDESADEIASVASVAERRVPMHQSVELLRQQSCDFADTGGSTDVES